MKISNLTIKNFRSIKESVLDLSNFNCLVGHNNAGKSTTLIAASLLKSSTKLKDTDFYDRNYPVEITATFEITNEKCFELLPDEHATRIKPLFKEGRLTISKIYDLEGSSDIRYLKSIPIDSRYLESSISLILKNKKSPASINSAIIEKFPELKDKVESMSIKTVDEAKQFLSALSANLPIEEMKKEWSQFPTGFQQSINPLLPEIIYIPAVKDISDEIKTKEASSLGKIIKILLEMIQQTEALQSITESFQELNQHLNILNENNSNRIDNRIPEIKEIENSVENFIKEQFELAKLQLYIPPPDIKQIFGNARLLIDDGIYTDVDQKGDGMKRAVLFALIRTFVSISRQRNSKKTYSNYLFLFEEPELYLHPQSQKILFEALNQLSNEHQVIVCTHSPFFLTPSNNGSIFRLKKIKSTDSSKSPISESLSINIHQNIDFKNAYQIICFENASAAFFSDKVILVEGDCDIIYLKYISSLFTNSWNFDSKNISIVKVLGKGNFSKFRNFFQAFGVEVIIVADLDIICDGFQHLNASETASNIRKRLMEKANDLFEKRGGDHQISKKQAKRLTDKKTFKENYTICKDLAKKMYRGEVLTSEEYEHFDKLFSEESSIILYEVIKSEAEIQNIKRELIDQLRDEKIIVLSRGAIEEYYPENVEGADKPTKALNARSKVNSIEEAKLLSDKWISRDGNDVTELELAFEKIFQEY